MITLYGFGRVFRPVIGETKDFRVQWALEEVGLPYRVHGLDHTGGELEGPAYSEISCFHLVPAIVADGSTVARIRRVLLYLAEKAGKLIPADVQGRNRVVQWCFAALNTAERPLMEIQLIDKFGSAGMPRSAERKWSRRHRWFDGRERRLEGRDWIACADFTIADILLATVTRDIRKTHLLAPYPPLTAYYARALARPAWRHTLSLYATRLGVEIADIQ